MITFLTYLLQEADEPVKAKLKHLEHIEELIINEGPEGAQRALMFIDRLIAAVGGKNDSKLAVNVKIDGAPSLTCGPMPAGEPNAGDFFVGTKSALNPNGKRYTKANADMIAAENSPGLAEKLTAALEYLPAVGIKSILQGDFLFTPGDLKDASINGKQYITFKPNTITYAVEKGSKAAKEVAQAKMGIVFHTVYEGDTIATMHATFNPDLSALKQTPDVWWKSNKVQDFSETMPHSKDAVSKLTRLSQKAQQEFKLIDKTLFLAMQENNQLASFIKMHLNSKVRQNELVGHIEQHIDQLAAFVDRRHQLDMEKFKTAKKQQQVAAARQQYAQVIQQLRPQLIALFTFFNTVTDIKLLFLQSVKSFGGIEAFFKNGDSYEKTAGEGLVIADTENNEITKIVDRLTFSQQNFNMQKDW